MSSPYTNDFDIEDALQTGNESLIAQQLRLAQRKEQLKQRMANGPRPPEGAMVSGYYIKPNLAAQLAPILGDALNTFESKAIDKEATYLDQRVAAAAAAHIRKAPAPDAPQQSKLAWAQQGALIPTFKPIAEAYLKDQLISEPERVEARAERKDRQAATVAEAQRKQQEELAYRRQRDQQMIEDRQQRAQESNDLRRVALTLGRSAGGGGDKASNYQLMTDDDGNVTRVNKLTGDVQPVAAKAGKSAGAVIKDQFDKQEKRTNAQKGIELLDQADSLLGKAAGGKMMSLRDSIAGAAGYSTDTAKAGAELDVIGNSIANMIPRMAGQVSDADLKFIQKQAGDLNNRDLPTETRRAAARAVRTVLQRTIDGGPAPAKPSNGPSIRDAVKAASQAPSDDELLNKYLGK